MKVYAVMYWNYDWTKFLGVYAKRPTLKRVLSHPNAVDIEIEGWRKTGASEGNVGGWLGNGFIEITEEELL